MDNTTHQMDKTTHQMDKSTHEMDKTTHQMDNTTHQMDKTTMDIKHNPIANIIDKITQPCIKLDSQKIIIHCLICFMTFSEFFDIEYLIKWFL